MSYENLVRSVKNSNTLALDHEVKKFEDLGYEFCRITGYGEFVFTLNVTMSHSRFGEVRLTTAQDPEDAEGGQVMFHPSVDFRGFVNYEF